MPNHASLSDAELHYCKHITTATTSDSGKVITPDSTTNGISTLRKLTLVDLDTSTALQTSSPLAAATVTVAATTEFLLMTPAGVLATLTVTLPTPSTTRKSQRLIILSTQNVTALTLSGTYVGATTALTANTAVEYISDGSSSWYKL